MDSNNLELILTEIRELRAEFNTYARETAERISVLETQTKSLLGNGQPGRMTLAENSIEKLEKWKYWLLGASSVCGCAAAALFHIIFRV